MSNEKNLIIHFPLMLKSLADERVHSSALFFNPGIYEPEDDCFRPDNLPLDSREVKSFLSQSIQFGEQFKKPSDMAYLGAQKPDDFYSETSLSLRWQISTYGKQDSKPSVDHELYKAQQLLLLEYVFEERIVEIRTINSSLGMTWSDFDRSLGIEREDEDFSALDRDEIFPATASTDWKKLLWAFALFIPVNSFLLINDEQVFQDLEEEGISWQEIESVHAQSFSMNFPQGSTLFSGVLNPGNKNPFLVRIKRPLKFLRINQSQNC